MAFLRTTVTGRIYLPDGSVMPDGANIIFTLRSWDKDGDREAIALPGPIVATVEDGAISVELIRTASTDLQVTYDVGYIYRNPWTQLPQPGRLGVIAISGSADVDLDDILALPAPVPDVPDALAQALAAAADAMQAAVAATSAAAMALVGTGTGFDTFAQMKASSISYGGNSLPTPDGGTATLNIGAGNILVTKEGGRYEIVALGTAKATMEAPGGYHIITDGGLLLRVLTKGGEFWLSHFGAVLDRTTDDSDALEMMFIALVGDGGGSGVVDGKARITRTMQNASLACSITLRGVKGEHSEIKLTTDDISALRFNYPSPDIPNIFDTGHDFIMEDLSVTGPWVENKDQSNADNWLVNITNCRYFIVKNCRVGSSQKGGINGYGWGSTQLIDSEIYECARGGWNVSRSMHTFCKGTIFRALNDDAISLHTPSNATTYRSQDHTVVDNDFIDCQGIAALGASNLLIANNRGKRMRGRFFIGGYSGSWSEGNSSFTGISIVNNIVHDCINLTSILGTGSYHNILDIDPIPLSEGVFNAAPGENVVTNGGVVSPWGNLQNVGDGAAHAGGWFVKVANNQFIRTMRAGPYSANEDGAKLFTETGYIDPTVTDAQLSPQILLGSGLRDVTFEGNEIFGFSNLRFFFGADGKGFRRIRFKNNTWMCCSTNGMIGYGGPGTRDKLDVTFEGDTFDGDPFFETTGHSNSGGWSSEEDLRVFLLPACTGLKVFRCHFKNVSVIQPQSGTYVIDDCFQYGEFYSSSFNAANKGIGRPLPWVRARQIPQDADSRSANWGMEMHGNMLDADSVPTSGNYMPGTRLKWRGSGAYTPDANGMLIRELIRVTACNAANDNHVLGTDWVYGYVSTASPAV